MSTYKIADLVIKLNMNEQYIHPNLKDFKCENITPDIEWSIVTGDMPDYIGDNNTTHIKNITLCKLEDKIILKLPDLVYYDIQMIVFSNNYKKAEFYLPKGYPDNKTREEQDIEREHIFSFLREAFFCACLYYQGISIHSASIIYKNNGIIFSGCSGTGKSTHTNMWREMFDIDILDGDVTVCRLLDGVPVVYGLPWCGTSQLYINKRVALGGVVFLKQAPGNRIYRPGILETFDRFNARSFTPMWFEELVELRITIIEEIIQKIPAYVLLCLPNKEAVYMVKEAIDNDSFEHL